MLNFLFFDLSLENFGVQILSSILKANKYNPIVLFKPLDTSVFNNYSVDESKIEEFS